MSVQALLDQTAVGSFLERIPCVPWFLPQQDAFDVDQWRGVSLRDERVTAQIALITRRKYHSVQLADEAYYQLARQQNWFGKAYPPTLSEVQEVACKAFSVTMNCLNDSGSKLAHVAEGREIICCKFNEGLYYLLSICAATDAANMAAALTCFCPEDAPFEVHQQVQRRWQAWESGYLLIQPVVPLSQPLWAVQVLNTF